MTRTCCLMAVGLGALLFAPGADAQTKRLSYAIAELSPESTYGSTVTSVRGVNNWGQVAGHSSGGTEIRACIWEPDGRGNWLVRDFGASDFLSDATAVGINDVGDVVGSKPLYPREGYFYDGLTGEFHTLPTPGEEFEPCGNRINNLGVVCGYLERGDYTICAAMWERTDGTWTVTNLADMFDTVQARSSANGINDNVQIVGSSSAQVNDFTTSMAHLWERDAGGTWTLTNLPGDCASASAINNRGQIVGSHSVNGSRHACIWQRVDGEWVLTDLSPFATGYPGSRGSGINESGQVLVDMINNSGSVEVACLYENGVMRNLNNFLPAAAAGSVLKRGKDINDYGQVVFFGYNPAGAHRAFLMDTRAVTYSYASTGSAVSIRDKSTASKSMTLTDNETITDLNVAVTLYHTRYADLKFELIGPNNVTRLLCNAGAITGSGTKTLAFDDDGAVGRIVPAQPLSYYDGTSTKGKWTLKISDTVRNFKTGSFTSFALDVAPSL